MPFTYPFTRIDLDRAGLSYAVLRGWLERGECRRVSNGLFLRTDLADRGGLTDIWASRHVATGQVAVSAYGAALLHNLPVPRGLSKHAKVPIPLPKLPVECRTNFGPIVAPTIEWTCLMLSRGQPLAGCLIPLDAAASREADLARLADLYASTERMGLRNFGRALNEVSALSGSPLESASRGWFVDWGLPRPILQQPFNIAGQQYYVDFYWPPFLLIGEADGLVKYVDDTELRRERRRQSALDSLGCRVIRWGWHDLEHSREQLRRTLQVALR